ncbi:hypothetical protein [Amycolatopsis eburnea]|uniref:Uncharacterized protein n=1 Tax=Amycolatopsis eburnea TaxID=2267691 RepID=A0A3R9F5G7_9PSEU|nr:hypothetical protein [Amycolatopsis eburnea]RSD16345.1 hypothetical protein EIY87_22085 [Amycolatopsis eburnea]
MLAKIDGAKHDQCPQILTAPGSSNWPIMADARRWSRWSARSAARTNDLEQQLRHRRDGEDERARRLKPVAGSDVNIREHGVAQHEGDVAVAGEPTSRFTVRTKRRSRGL